MEFVDKKRRIIVLLVILFISCLLYYIIFKISKWEKLAGEGETPRVICILYEDYQTAAYTQKELKRFLGEYPRAKRHFPCFLEGKCEEYR